MIGALVQFVVRVEVGEGLLNKYRKPNCGQPRVQVGGAVTLEVQ